MRAIATALLFTAALLGSPVVLASPPPPPPPDSESGLIQQSCGAKTTRVLPTQVAVTINAIDPQTVGVRQGKIGYLSWQWGFRITSKDARLGQVVGLTLNNDFGLVAVTRDGNWLTLDLQNGTVAALKTVGIAPIEGGFGTPSSLSQMYNWTLVSYPERNLVTDFALSTCGMAARPATLFTTTGYPKATIVTQGADTYVGLVGQEGDSVKSGLALLDGTKDVQLTSLALPSMPGYRLQALSNPVKIVPYFIAAWRHAKDSPETLIQRLHIPAWSDMWAPGDSNIGTDLASFPRPLAALTSVYIQQSKTTVIFAIAETKQPGTFDIYAFTDSSKM